MIKTTNIIKAILLLILLSLMIGCNEKSQTQALSIANGDNLIITLKPMSKNLKMVFDSKESSLNIVEENQTSLCVSFVDVKHMKDHIEGIRYISKQSNSEIKQKTNETINSLIYQTIEYKDEGGNVIQKILGWIEGSNTGVIISVSNPDINNSYILEVLDFDVKKTKQTDPTFYYTEIFNVGE